MSSAMYQETKKTIFIADSSESFLIYLRILLERMGFRIIPLKKGAILQELIHVLKPDLVMLGRALEDMEGMSVLRNTGMQIGELIGQRKNIIKASF